MEIKLKFNEALIHSRTKKWISDQLIEKRNKIKGYSIHIIWLIFIISILFLLAAYINQDWIIYSFIAFGFMIVKIIQISLIHLVYNRKIKSAKRSTVEWINKNKKIGNVKYEYDTHNIKYFEKEKLVESSSWDNLSSIVED